MLQLSVLNYLEKENSLYIKQVILNGYIIIQVDLLSVQVVVHQQVVAGNMTCMMDLEEVV